MTDNYHEKMYEVSRSFVMVYNPTEEDFIVRWAQSGIHSYAGGGATGEPPQEWVIPSKNKDAGYGKGKREVPFYIAEKFNKEMSELRYHNIADQEYQSQKKKKLGKEFTDFGDFAEWWRVNINTYVNRDELFKKYRQEQILGITKRYSDQSTRISNTQARKTESEQLIDQFESLPEYNVIQANKESLINDIADNDIAE